MITKALILAIIVVESGGNPDAVSPTGAQGLMQMTEIAVKEVNSQYGITTQPDLGDPYVNVCYGILLLDFYYSTSGSIKGAVITYNGGYAQLARWRNGVPLTPETAEYLPKVLHNRARLNRMFDAELSPSSGIGAIVDDVWDDLYGTGEGGEGFLSAGGLYTLRDSEGPNTVLCRVPM
jgi:soluble lytic murein transglycosylase-like protein